MNTILIVDDDADIGDLLETALVGEGYAVARAYSGTEALYVLRGRKPDLVLLDLMLPGLTGQELLPELRGVPVIVVSARAAVEDKVELLLSGAADYVTKPFELRELMARIAARLRREPAAPTHLERGAVALDTDTRQVLVNGSPARLTRTEYAILKLLMQNPGAVVTKSRLLDSISEDTPDCTESSLKTHMSHLRSKLPPDTIESVWGIGFKLN